MGRGNSILQTESKAKILAKINIVLRFLIILIFVEWTGNSGNILLNRNIVNGLIMFNIMDGQYCILDQQKPDNRLNTSDMFHLKIVQT